MNTTVPEGYKSILSVYDTQKAIGLMKRLFEDRFAAVLNLFRVSAPLFVEGKSGLNDNLNGWERPVDFDIAHTGRTLRSCSRWQSGNALHSSVTTSIPARASTQI